MMRPESAQTESVNYKKKYQALKKKLKLLVYEQECFTDELRKSQRKLLKVSRDRSYLLDRLLQYEHVEDSSSDSESTASSDSGNEIMPKDTGSNINRKKRPMTAMHVPSAAHPTSSAGAGGMPPLVVIGDPGASGAAGRLSKEPAKKKPKVTVRKIPVKTLTIPSKLSPGQVSRGPAATSSALASILEQPILSGTGNLGVSPLPRAALSREEIERHLDLKHSTKPQFLSIDMMPHSLPDDIFSHDNSNQECAELQTDNIKVEVDDSDLVIDMT